MNLLIVDDEKIIREGIQKMVILERPNVNVFTAQNATEATKIIHNNKIDAMLLDIQLHKTDGLTFLKNIHSEGYTPMAAIISGYDKFEYAQAAMSENAIEYLLKPVSPKKVLQLVDRFQSMNSEKEVNIRRQDLMDTGDNYLVTFVKKYVQENYDKPIGIAMLADNLGYSSNYLGKLFNSVEGKSINQYVCEYRMEIAKQLLSETGIKVNEIAKKVGYQDNTYFATTFKRMEGIQPSEYRKNMFKSK